MEAEMFTHFSAQTQKFRFFELIKDISHEMLIRYTQIDYDREIAIIAEETDEKHQKHMLGVARIIGDSYGENAEFAIVVADPWQHLGIGSILMDYALDIARDRHINTVYAYVLQENTHMISMMQKRGFICTPSDDSVKATLHLP